MYLVYKDETIWGGAYYSAPKVLGSIPPLSISLVQQRKEEEEDEIIRVGGEARNFPYSQASGIALL